MVDVGSKPVTERRARATARVRMSPETATAVARGDAPKGDVLGTARIAGINALGASLAQLSAARRISRIRSSACA